MALFPLSIAVSAIAVIAAGLLWHPAALPALPIVLYLWPLLAWRLHQWVFPLETGMSDLAAPEYSPWWGGHQIQWIYIAFPALETALRMVPGLFSLWLRLWGSRIGRGVFWTPHVEITDRSLLELGDGVIVGHQAGFYGHVIAPRGETLRLLVRPVRIGERAFLGAGSRFGPGVRVEAGALVPVRSELGPGRKVKA